MTRVERDSLRALVARAVSSGLSLSADLLASRAWSSALFGGFRLTVAITAEDDERLDQWLALLPDAELLMRDHVVASAEVIARSDRAATVELLVVEG